MILFTALLVLSLALLTAVALVRHDHPTDPPRSHFLDDRFLPPSARVH